MSKIKSIRKTKENINKVKIGTKTLQAHYKNLAL